MEPQVLTAGVLRERLEGVPDDVPVIVTCENRCDPHPVRWTFLRRTEEREDGMVFAPHFELTGDEHDDFRKAEFEE